MGDSDGDGGLVRRFVCDLSDEENQYLLLLLLNNVTHISSGHAGWAGVHLLPDQLSLSCNYPTKRASRSGPGQDRWCADRRHHYKHRCSTTTACTKPIPVSISQTARRPRERRANGTRSNSDLDGVKVASTRHRHSRSNCPGQEYQRAMVRERDGAALEGRLDWEIDGLDVISVVIVYTQSSAVLGWLWY